MITKAPHWICLGVGLALIVAALGIRGHVGYSDFSAVGPLLPRSPAPAGFHFRDLAGVRPVLP